jgi:exodeoxyribonuclease III
VKIASWNVNSVKVRLPHLLDYLNSAQPDVLCLQEIKCPAEDFPQLEVQALGYRVEALGQRAYNGVALISREPPREIVFGLPEAGDDDQARYIEASFTGAAGRRGPSRLAISAERKPDRHR